MLNDTELELWKLKLGISTSASALIDNIRSSEPVRLVRGSGRNVTGRYPSKKMGHTIQFESHTCELPFILLCEFPEIDDVLEYWDQPITLQLVYKNSKGRAVRVNHVPDFFVMRDNKVEFVECKTEETLIKLATKYPDKFCLDAAGQWHCPPGEQVAAKYGIHYRVLSSADIDRTFYRNTIFLEDYLREDNLPTENTEDNPLVKFISQEGGLRLSALLERALESGASADDVYQLIACGSLYADLSQEALVNRDRVFVYSSKPAAMATKNHSVFPKSKFVELKTGVLVQWGNNTFEIVNVDQNNVWLVGEMNHPTLSREHFEHLVRKGEISSAPKPEEPSGNLSWEKILSRSKPIEQREAQRRYDLLIKYYKREPLGENVPLRTLERWSANYKRATLLYGNGLVGLIPRWARRGDRSTTRISAPVLKLMAELIENDYERNIQSGMFVVYGKLRLACKEAREKPPSYQTFVRYIQKRPKHEQDLKRMGSRAAYDSEPFYYFLEKDTPRHGDRPFEICHMDHTLLDIVLVDPLTGQNFGRPWATFLVDAFSRRILVAYLSFESPSYRTCMMVMRDCVRRFGRLPQTLVVDGGPDFKSIYFECLAAAFEITIKRRPKAKARFGSVIENLFNVSNEQFIYNLIANTQLTRKNVRHATPSHDPRNLAVWSLEPLYERLCNWAYERYDKEEHATLKQSPHSLYVNTIQLTGERKHRLIAYNEEFRTLTLPTTKKGTAKNIQGRGVKINREYYWNAVLDERDLLEKQLPVKYDPYDYTIAWVYAHKKWFQCLSQDHYQVKSLTESEMRLRSAHKHRGNTLFARRAGERAENRARGTLEDQKREAELSKDLALLYGQQREDAIIKRIINGTSTEQFTEEQAVSTHRLPMHQTGSQEHALGFSSIATSNIEILEDYV